MVNNNLDSSLISFHGKLLIIIGFQDEVIPKEVIEQIYTQATISIKKEIFILPKVPHLIGKWVSGNPENSQFVVNKIKEFLA